MFAIVVVPVCGKPASITLPRIKLEAFVVIHGCMRLRSVLGETSRRVPLAATLRSPIPRAAHGSVGCRTWLAAEG